MNLQRLINDVFNPRPVRKPRPASWEVRWTHEHGITTGRHTTKREALESMRDVSPGVTAEGPFPSNVRIPR